MIYIYISCICLQSTYMTTYDDDESKMETFAERRMQVLQKLILTALKSARFIGLPSRTDTYIIGQNSHQYHLSVYPSLLCMVLILIVVYCGTLGRFFRRVHSLRRRKSKLSWARFWECPMATLLRIVDCRQEQCVGDRCSWCLTPSMAWSDSWYWHIIKWAKKRDSHHHWSSPNCFNYFLASTQEADSLLRQILQRSRGRQTSSLLPLVWAIKKIKTMTMAMTLTVTMIIRWCHLVRVHSSTSLALHQWKQPVESKVICTSGYLCYLSRLWWLGWF